MIPVTSRTALYVYLFHPLTEQWVTAGRLDVDSSSGTGQFIYAPSFLDSGEAISIDPINLPLLGPGKVMHAHRYQGLHDVFRDATPDAWGQLLLQREHGLPFNAHAVQYLIRSGNSSRWGALAFGRSRRPNVAELSTPRLEQLEALCTELLAIYEQRPASNDALRRLLVQSPSLGGARPKSSIRDRLGNYWLVKPRHSGDAHDVPQLEFAVAQWATAAGLNFAPTQLHYGEQEKMLGIGVLASQRFDRRQQVRRMVLSGATLLAAHFPSASPRDSERWSYPRLALALGQLGVPVSDLHELFGRMVFNALVGNDDDHPRNHAVVFDSSARQWRLAPAYDVVPNLEMDPPRLAMQLSHGQFECSREAILADAMKFGLDSEDQARSLLNNYIGTFLNTLDTAMIRISSGTVKDLLYQRVTARARKWAL